MLERRNGTPRQTWRNYHRGVWDPVGLGRESAFKHRLCVV